MEVRNAKIGEVVRIAWSQEIVTVVYQSPTCTRVIPNKTGEREERSISGGCQVEMAPGIAASKTKATRKVPKTERNRPKAER